LIINATCQ